MKSLLVLFSFLTASSAFALNIEENADTAKVLQYLPSYVWECRKKAIVKLSEQAEAYGVKIDINTLRISGWDSNIVAAYIDWSVDLSPSSEILLPGGEKVLTKLTQKPTLKACF